MHTIKNTTCVILLFIFNYSFAQKNDSVFVNASLTKSTVYYGFGADLFHSCKVNLAQGMQELVINNIAINPDINTIQIACPENITILSYTHRIYYNSSVIKPDPSNLRSYDTIKQYQKIIARYNNQISINSQILDKTTKLIENNCVGNNQKNTNAVELIKLISFYNEKIKSIQERNFLLHNEVNLYQEKIDAINERLSNNENINPVEKKPVGQLLLQVMAKESGSAVFDVNYYTRNAGWIPSYDVRVKTLDNKFKLVYKAMVSQTTGLNWNNVKLNLSTSSPNESNIVPILSPTYLQLYVPVIYKAIYDKKVAYSAVPMMKEMTVSSDDVKTPIDVEISNNNISDNLTVQESLLNTNFEIDLPYDIPCDGVAYSVNIKEENISVSYQHFAVPKLDKSAFLMARIISWDSLNLLPGQANIILDNVYIGKSYLNPNTTQDTLELSLGRDQRIAIDRQLKKEYTSIKKSDTKIETYTYEITIKNNKKQPIEMILKDQFPVSKTKEVEVVLKNSDEAVVDSETGALNWNVKLQPGESKKYRFSYQVKYPKGRCIQEVK